MWGPAQVTSVGGNKYALFGTDTGTLRDMVELLKDCKAETILAKLEIRRAIAETQTGKKLKRIRTDNTPEFCSQNFKEWTTKHGIVHEFTAPYSSLSNRAAE
ncbi:hypothetical protein D9758_010067 [Tetrapyrgos nigripes]|uniref:Integrase catalytic domain-containing protein n=1 Tax=Tetrapyrgos nigripes TaxID=182062 RepID=A0A8H5FTD6_9AGAR|nr:hypothetical protein D9758_010067 [Tetrapyrgos nigripes]